jgi:hypothetical protein
LIDDKGFPIKVDEVKATNEVKAATEDDDVGSQINSLSNKMDSLERLAMSQQKLITRLTQAGEFASTLLKVSPLPLFLPICNLFWKNMVDLYLPLRSGGSGSKGDVFCMALQSQIHGEPDQYQVLRAAVPMPGRQNIVHGWRMGVAVY